MPGHCEEEQEAHHPTLLARRGTGRDRAAHHPQPHREVASASRLAHIRGREDQRTSQDHLDGGRNDDRDGWRGQRKWRGAAAETAEKRGARLENHSAADAASSAA